MSDTLFTEARMPTSGRLPLPKNACDCHTHVFGRADRYHLANPPGFALPSAPPELHRAMRKAAGLGRAVLVQPAYYGFDHSALLDALRVDDEARGIGLADASVTDRDLETLDHGGVLGLRFTEAPYPGGGSRPGSVGADQLVQLAPRLRELQWQAHLWAGASFLEGFFGDAALPDIPLVIDHMGMVDLSAGIAARPFQALLGALREGRVWVKLSLCRVSHRTDFEDARPFHDALVEANPGRLLWGSDWPFIRLFERSPDVGELLDTFLRWVPEPELQQMILIENPATLFRFK
jgi:predicted TIM-barrel fold metal-dependent hydrolase